MSFLWNWLSPGRANQNEEDDSLPPPAHLDDTSVLRSDSFIASTPTAGGRQPPTTTAAATGQPSIAPQLQTGQENIQVVTAQVHNDPTGNPIGTQLTPRFGTTSPNQDEAEDSSEFSTENEEPNLNRSIPSAREALRVAKKACEDNFRTLTRIDLSRESNLEDLQSTQRRYHQFLNEYQTKAENLNRLLIGKRLADQKRTFKTNYNRYLGLAKRLESRIKEVQRIGMTSSQQQQTQSGSNQQYDTRAGRSQTNQRGVHFQNPTVLPSESQQTQAASQTRPVVMQPGTQSFQGHFQPSGNYQSPPQFQNRQPSFGYTQQIPTYPPPQGPSQFYQPPPGACAYPQMNTFNPIASYNLSTSNISLNDGSQARYDGRGMPKYDLETFKGERLDYARFKNSFMAIIGSRQIYAEEKALRLFNLLEGEPRKLIAGVLEGNITSFTHGMMWDILDKFYGGQLSSAKKPLRR